MKHTTRNGRLLSLLLCLAMVLSLFSGLTFSAGAVDSVTYVDSGYHSNAAAATAVTASDTEWGTAGAETWYYADGTVTISNTVTVNGNVSLILADGCSLTVTGTSGGAGIRVTEGNSLTIYGQTNQTGALTATGSEYDIDAHTYAYGSGIGGSSFSSDPEKAGTIEIYGGCVTAKSGRYGQGIGGGSYFTYETFTPAYADCEKVVFGDAILVKAPASEYSTALAVLSGTGSTVNSADAVQGKVTVSASWNQMKEITEDESGKLQLTVKPAFNWYVGHEDDTSYTIPDTEALEAMAFLVNNGFTKFEGKTLTLSDTFDGSKPFTEVIGQNWQNYFNGTFDGNFKTVNLNIDKTQLSDVGMFGLFGRNAVVKNLSVTGSVKVTNSSYEGIAGGIAGYMSGSYTDFNARGTIMNCTSSVDVTVTSTATGSRRINCTCAGVIAGEGTGNIINCYATGSATASGNASTASASGITGNFMGTLQNCYFYGTLSSSNSYEGGDAYIGGIMASDMNPANLTYSDCYYLETSAANGIGYIYGDSYTDETTAMSAADMTATEGDSALLTKLNSFVDGGTIAGLVNWKIDAALNNGYPVLKAPHTHTWDYTLSEDGKTITAACSGAGTCEYTGTDLSTTISAPTSLDYDGNAKAASLSSDTLAGTTLTITYTDAEGAALTGAPTEPGTYTASVTAGTVTASVSYTIDYPVTHHEAANPVSGKDGNVEYWEKNGTKYSDAACTTEISDVTVHYLAADSFTWTWTQSEDGKWTADYTAECANGDETALLTGDDHVTPTVTTDDTDPAKTVHTATVTAGGVTSTSTKEIIKYYQVTIDRVRIDGYTYGQSVSVTGADADTLYDWTLDGTTVLTNSNTYSFSVAGNHVVTSTIAADLVSAAKAAIDDEVGEDTTENVAAAAADAKDAIDAAATAAALETAKNNGIAAIQAAKAANALAAQKEAARDDIDTEVGEDTSESVAAAAAAAKTAIDAAATPEAVETAKADGIAAIQAAKAGNELAAAKTTAKLAIDTEAGEDDAENVTAAAADAKDAIDAATTIADVEAAKNDGIDAIDAAKAANALAAAKEAADTAIDDEVGSDTSENVTQAAADAKDAIDAAATTDAVEAAKADGIAAIQAAKAANALAAAKEAANTAIDEEVGDDTAENVTAAAADAKDAIDAATTPAEVETAKNYGIAAIDEAKAANALAAAKEAADTAIDEEVGDDTAENVLAAAENAKAAIDAATTPEAVEAAKADGIAAIQAAKQANIKNGWLKEDGKWYYYVSDEVQKGWFTDPSDGKTYYLDPDTGAMLKGWQQVDGKWYYLNNSLQTGIQKINGKWYDLNADAATPVSTWNAEQSWFTYTAATGEMLTGWVKDGGKWYYFGTNGARVSGWVKEGDKWFYMNPAEDSSNEMLTGWQLIGGKWYYLNSSMQTGWQQIDGKWYYLNNSMQTGWQQVGGKWYYLNTSMVTGWQQISGKWYYFDTKGAMVSSCIMKIDGRYYAFDSHGVCKR